MGRKRDQGRARKAAKAKAQQEAEERENNNQTTAPEQSLADHLIPAHTRQLQSRSGNVLPTSGHDTTPQCNHGFEIRGEQTTVDFIEALSKAFDEVIHRGDIVFSLFKAVDATMDEFADMWNDSTKTESAISFFLSAGTDFILNGKYQYARRAAIYARFIEQYIAVMLKQKPLFNIPKLQERYDADLHTLVKFFRHRIPCSCLDEKYEEVKNITKMGLCFNLQCTLPNRMTDRSKTMYCSRCRCATYCSRKCQEFDWASHKTGCDRNAEGIAEFEAEQLK